MYNWNIPAELAKEYGPETLMNLQALQSYLNKNLDINDEFKKAAIYDFDFTHPPVAMFADDVLENYADQIYDEFFEIEHLAVPSNITPPCSRHYESEAVAMVCCGVWVGWIRWTGGGKHGEPEAMDKTPHFLNVVSATEISVIKYTFEAVST